MLHRFLARMRGGFLCAKRKIERYPRKFCIWRASVERLFVNIVAAENARDHTRTTRDDKSGGAENGTREHRLSSDGAGGVRGGKLLSRATLRGVLGAMRTFGRTNVVTEIK
jgi:hypothetical protein